MSIRDRVINDAGSVTTHAVRFAREVEWLSGELGECLEEDTDERVDVLRSVLCGLYGFTIIGVRVSNANPVASTVRPHAPVLVSGGDPRLIQEEDVSFVVPRVRVPSGPVGGDVLHINIAGACTDTINDSSKTANESRRSYQAPSGDRWQTNSPALGFGTRQHAIVRFLR